MALITCPECGREISSFADMCVHCGFPISRNIFMSTCGVGCKDELMNKIHKTDSYQKGKTNQHRMPANDIIKELMNIRKWTQRELALAAGYKSQSNITGILNRGYTMRVNNLVLLVETMDAEVIVRDKMCDKQEWTISTTEAFQEPKK